MTSGPTTSRQTTDPTGRFSEPAIDRGRGAEEDWLKHFERTKSRSVDHLTKGNLASAVGYPASKAKIRGDDDEAFAIASPYGLGTIHLPLNRVDLKLIVDATPSDPACYPVIEQRLGAAIRYVGARWNRRPRE